MMEISSSVEDLSISGIIMGSVSIQPDIEEPMFMSGCFCCSIWPLFSKFLLLALHRARVSFGGLHNPTTLCNW